MVGKLQTDKTVSFYILSYCMRALKLPYLSFRHSVELRLAHTTWTWDLGCVLKWVSSGQTDPTIGAIQIAILNCTVRYAKIIKKRKREK
jgi:hypothetical protein